MNNNTEDNKSQAILKKLAIKKAYNNYIIDWLENDLHDEKTALNIKGCATQVGITDVNGITKIVRANFCRERICNICAWRRQAKFTAQMFPTLNYISSVYGYEYILIGLTLKNVTIDNVNTAVNTLLEGYKKIARCKRFREAFHGVIRSLEITYKAEENEFHPHLHLMCAVDKRYFLSNYVTQQELSFMWKTACNLSYIPVVHIEKITDDMSGAVETLKYSLKPSKAKEALFVMYSTLKGRRLVSFSGCFAYVRRELKLSDFDTILTDDVNRKQRRYYDIYEFDVTGGVYTFYKSYLLE